MKLLVCLGLFSGLVFAKTPQGFSDRFEIKKINQVSHSIVLKAPEIVPSVFRLLTQIQEDLTREQDLMKKKSNYYLEVEELLFEEMWQKGVRSSELSQWMIKALKALENQNLMSMTQGQGQSLMQRFDNRLKELLADLDPRILSKMQDPQYFFKRQAGHQFVVWALKILRQVFSETPILNIMTTLVTKTEALVSSMRVYYQNMLLFYLEKSTPAELGLTEEEADFAFSSIYESRIHWLDFLTRNMAKENWREFGVSRFYQDVRGGIRRLNDHKSRYEQVNGRLAYAFAEVQEEGKKKIVNLYHGKDLFRSFPSTAFEYDRPTRVKRQRELLRLVQMGLGLLTVPGIVKSMLNRYIDSLYVEQRQVEGALIAYLRSIGQDDLGDMIQKQNINPFAIY